jgi:hypothetical protein
VRDLSKRPRPTSHPAGCLSRNAPRAIRSLTEIANLRQEKNHRESKHCWAAHCYIRHNRQSLALTAHTLTQWVVEVALFVLL